MPGDALDTNVIVYLFEHADERKHRLARKLVDDAMVARTAFISYQVLQETVQVLASRLRISDAEIIALLNQLADTIWTVYPTRVLFECALQLRQRYQLHFYDALVVAGAIEGGAERLLTEDLQHGQVIEGIRIENPFLEAS